MPTWYHWVSVFIFNLIDLIKRNAQCRLTSLTTIDPIPDVLMYWYTAQYTTPPLMYWFTIQLTTPSLICTDVYWCTDVLHNWPYHPWYVLMYCTIHNRSLLPDFYISPQPQSRAAGTLAWVYILYNFAFKILKLEKGTRQGKICNKLEKNIIKKGYMNKI